jgi:hypothetical protein
MEKRFYGNRAISLATYELLQGIQMYDTYRGKFKVEQQLYEMIASNFLFNFIPKELLYVKNNSSKYELKLSAARCVSDT